MGNNPLSFVDPDGRDIFFVVNGLPRRQVLKLRKAYKVLYATDDGKQYLSQFANNPNKDLYVGINYIGEDDGAATYRPQNGEFNSSQPLDMARISSKLAQFSNFNGIIPGQSQWPQVSFVNMNSKFMNSSTELLANILGHEVGSHALNGDDKKHIFWGSHSAPGTGKNFATKAGEWRRVSGSPAEKLAQQVRDIGRISRSVSAAAMASFKIFGNVGRAAVRTPRYSF